MHLHLPTSTRLALLLTLAFISFTFLVVEASSGDRSQEFQLCLAHCQNTKCSNGTSSSSSIDTSLPLSLQLTRWSCLDNCKYTCMHSITDISLRFRRPVLQYYGKWPFWRVFGMQEPASVLFSLANLWAHVKGVKLVRRKVPTSHPMRRLYVLWGCVSMNAWFWSAVFHMRGMLFRSS